MFCDVWRDMECHGGMEQGKGADSDKRGIQGWGGIVIWDLDQDLQEKEPFRWVFGGTGVEASSGGMSTLSYRQRRVSRAGKKGMMGQEVKGGAAVFGQDSRV